MKTQVFFVTALTLALFGCKPSNEEPLGNEPFLFNRVDSLVLQENLAALSDIYSVTTFSNGSYAVVSSEAAGVYKYDSGGQQVYQIGAWGEGPFQYEQPKSAIMRLDTLYIWDDKRFRYLAFDAAGSGLFESRTFNTHVRDFYVTRGRVFQLLSTSEPGPYFADTNMLIDNAPLSLHGMADFQHTGMMRFQNTGQIAGDDAYVWFAAPAKPIIYRYEIQTSHIDSVTISDSNFKQADFSFAQNPQDIVSDIKRLVEILNTSSRFIGMHRLDDVLVAEMEHGELSLDSVKNTRYTRLHILDKDLSYKGSITLDKRFRTRYGDRIVGTHGNMVYFVRPAETSDGTDLSWVLYRFAVTSQIPQEAH